MRILALGLVGCGATPAPGSVVIAAAPSDAALDTAPPDVPAKLVGIDDVSVAAPSPGSGRTPRIPISALAPTAGEVDRAAIRTMVKQHLQEIVACYETWSPNATPKVVVRFTIGADGRVQRSQASGAQAELENCIARLYKGFVFPPPAGGGSVMVTYPLIIDSAGN